MECTKKVPLMTNELSEKDLRELYEDLVRQQQPWIDSMGVGSSKKVSFTKRLLRRIRHSSQMSLPSSFVIGP